MYGFQSYISMPIFLLAGSFGTLCAIDPHPAKLKNPGVVGMFSCCRMIAYHLDGRRLATGRRVA